jgi:hypothetical protein
MSPPRCAINGEAADVLSAIGVAAALVSALLLYLASPNCRRVQPPARRRGLRVAGAAAALLALAVLVAALGTGAGLCAMFAAWMLGLIALPYLAQLLPASVGTAAEHD